MSRAVVLTQGGFPSAGERAALEVPGSPSHPAAGVSVPLTVALTAAGGDSMCSQPLHPCLGQQLSPNPATCTYPGVCFHHIFTIIL